MWPTVQQKSGRCGEVAVSEGLTEYRSVTVRCLQTFYKHLKVDYYHNYLVKRLCICLFLQGRVGQQGPQSQFIAIDPYRITRSH